MNACPGYTAHCGELCLLLVFFEVGILPFKALLPPLQRKELAELLRYFLNNQLDSQAISKNS